MLSWGLNFVFHYNCVEFLSSVSDEEATTEAKRNEEGGKTSNQEEHEPDFVIDSPQRSSLISGKDDNNWNNATENKGTRVFFSYHMNI